jgi:hypothetical protein
MADIHYVSSNVDLPSDQKYVLVEYGNANKINRHPQGITVTIDRSMQPNLLEAHAETAIGEAQAMADQENIKTVFVTVPKRN